MRTNFLLPILSTKYIPRKVQTKLTEATPALILRSHNEG